MTWKTFFATTQYLWPLTIHVKSYGGTELDPMRLRTLVHWRSFSFISVTIFTGRRKDNVVNDGRMVEDFEGSDSNGLASKIGRAHV